jgi:exodeoxyribonuclease V alpha subunit
VEGNARILILFILEMAQMMDITKWERLASEYYLSQPLDRFIVERLTDALPASRKEARLSFERGAKLLCASLNKGDTFLPLAEKEFMAAVQNWLDIPEHWKRSITLKEKQEEYPAGQAVVEAAEVKTFLSGHLAKFVSYLDAKAFETVVSDPEKPNRPMVYDPEKKRLYFERYFQAVRDINAALTGRFGDFPFETALASSTRLIADILRTTPDKMRPDARQTAALFLAMRNKTLLVSGGPGTGKTTVVLQIVRLLMRALPWLTAEDVRIAAPTGRAAARLQESIATGLAAILGGAEGGDPMRNRDESLAALRGTTVHRLLGFNPSSATYLRGAENPLDAAVVVVDEVSMLDIELFSRLLEALPPQCVLILLGDRFQLPPVEAGAVLGDLTAGFDRKKGDSLSERTVKDVKEILAAVGGGSGAEDETDFAGACGSDASILRDRAVILTRSYRSCRTIQELARAINNNENPMALLGPPADVAMHPWEDLLKAVPEEGRHLWLECGTNETVFPKLEGWLMHHFGPAYRELLKQDLLDAEARPGSNAPLLLDAIESSRILTVVREGDRGASGINEKCCKSLARIFDPAGKPAMFHGLPIMITRNAPGLELYNGDCGVLLRDQGNGFTGLFRVGKEYMTHPAGVLPHWEPAFAMTVHKSQGSEYNHVLLVLPRAANPLCTREILYTAITRAKKLAALVGDRNVLEHGLGRIVSRNTGIDI